MCQRPRDCRSDVGHSVAPYQASFNLMVEVAARTMRIADRQANRMLAANDEIPF
jgi:hypothetical protein